MPLYEYHCEECGRFSALRKMSESSAPAPCIQCGELSERVISVPYFALLAPGIRVAHEKNEKSAHEPQAIRRSSCGCNGKHVCNSNSSSANNVKAEQTAGGERKWQMQTKQTARPWMLGN